MSKMKMAEARSTKALMKHPVFEQEFDFKGQYGLNLTEDRVFELKKIFAIANQNGSGVIGRKQFVDLMQLLRISPTEVRAASLRARHLGLAIGGWTEPRATMPRCVWGWQGQGVGSVAARMRVGHRLGSSPDSCVTRRKLKLYTHGHNAKREVGSMNSQVARL
jgi:hypothetical protein